MFTGIIENTASVLNILPSEGNIIFTLQSDVANEFHLDQSIAHNGICLTVTSVNTIQKTYTVCAIKETLQRTNARNWKPQDRINLERCLKVDGRFDGHIVQGHVDCVGTIEEIHETDGSYLIFVSYPPASGITVQKGSITVNGVSLTVVDSFPDAFSIAIIPYTWEFTNLKELSSGDLVNLEFDIIGKYLQKIAAPN